MAIHIKELIIRAICSDQKDQNVTQAPLKQNKELATDKLSYAQRKQIVEDCTAEVLQRLRNMNDL